MGRRLPEPTVHRAKPYTKRDWRLDVSPAMKRYLRGFDRFWKFWWDRKPHPLLTLSRPLHPARAAAMLDRAVVTEYPDGSVLMEDPNIPDEWKEPNT